MFNKKIAPNKAGKTQIEQAKFIKRTLGVKVAARYLALRGWSVDAALWELLRTTQRFETLAFA